MSSSTLPILVLSDNVAVLGRFASLARRLNCMDGLRFAGSAPTEIASTLGVGAVVGDLDLRTAAACIAHDYAAVISLHCQQIIPRELLAAVRCVNIHPGYVPFNRGWFPHVFSIVNGKPAGATIHEMTDRIDLGPIIARAEVLVYPDDTSTTLYIRTLEAEFSLIREHLPAIISNRYATFEPEHSGNLNTKKDYETLKRFVPDELGSFRQFYDRLRALSHEGFANAYLDLESKRVAMRLIVNDH